MIFALPEAPSLTRVLQSFSLLDPALAPLEREWARVFDPGAHLLWKLSDAEKLQAWLDENRAHLKSLKVLQVTAGSERQFSIYIDKTSPREAKDSLVASAKRLGKARAPLPYERLKLKTSEG